MKDAVPELTVEDLAAIKAILPNFISYSYLSHSEVDNNTAAQAPILQVYFGKQVSQLANKAKHTRAMSNRGDEFSSKTEELQRHLVKPQTILKTIQQNNAVFAKALGAFVQEMDSQGKDSEVALEELLQQYIPLEPSPEVTLSTHPDSSTTPTDTDKQYSIETVLAEMRQQPFYHGQLGQDIYQTTLSAKSAQYGTVNSSFSSIVNDALKHQDIHQLYLHQAEAINGFKQGKNVITSTSTASGKSLIYQIAILETLQQNPSARSLLVFPTKALAQDQRRSLIDWLLSIPSLGADIKVSTYDGDTPIEQRATIRASSNVILTNPDMLHFSILPNAAKHWNNFFYSLKLVVIDEIHVYHGAFGANMAFILRRLRRLTNEYFHNQNIQFISCSATISSPEMHMEQLVGISNVLSIKEDGAPSALKKMVIWNPPLIDANSPQVLRRGAIAETADLLEFLMSRKMRTIVFCKIRKTCELLMKQMREHLEKSQRQDLLSKVYSYRGGYMPSTRRRIEQQMFRGDLLAIIATNALELGIDIGELDAVIMVGVPWSLSNFWQQSGRAGRRNNESLTMVVVDQNPMDQYYVKHPQDLFTKNIPPFSLELDKHMILNGHLQCAAQELPISIDRDEKYFGYKLSSLCHENLICLPDVNVYRPHPSRSDNPWQYVNIRGMMEEETYAIVDVTDNKKKIILEEIEATRAPFEIYIGAVFIHQGRSYLVDDLNVDKRYATVHLVKVDWITRQRDFTNVNVLETKKRKPILSDTPFPYVCFGNVEIETVVFGYHKLDRRNRILDSVDIYMDPITHNGLGLWVEVSSQIIHKLEEYKIDPMAAVHAASHMLLLFSPRITNSVSSEIKTECKSPHATRKRPNRVIIYEATPCGILHQIYGSFESLVKACQQQIDSCECSGGCPKCKIISFFV
ncbi:unnamed protein product [Absidia cylindrospora]